MALLENESNMMTLGDFSKRREENLIGAIDLFKDILSKHKELKVIVSDLSKRLFLKMVEDGLVSIDDAFIDLEQAKNEYIKRRQTEEKPVIEFILSPILYKFFGDEEVYYIDKFVKSLGLAFSDINENAIPYWLIALKTDNSASFITDTMALHMRSGKFNFELIDIIRYILGIYEIKDKKVIITSKEIYPKIKSGELAFDIIKKHYETMFKEFRFSSGDPDRFFNSFGGHRGKLDYLTSSFTRTTININELTNIQKEDLEELTKWGLLTLDTDGLYHFNHETYSILPFILDFDGRLYNIYQKIFGICSFFKYRDEKNQRDNLFKVWINYIDDLEVKEKIAFFTEKFNYILSNYLPVLNRNSLIAFQNYCDELRCFKGLYEEKNQKLIREK